jgi:hypothetical protein
MKNSGILTRSMDSKLNLMAKKVDNAKKVFTNMVNTLQKTNNELVTMKDEAVGHVNYYQNVAQMADKQISDNTMLMEKISQFLG